MDFVETLIYFFFIFVIYVLFYALKVDVDNSLTILFEYIAFFLICGFLGLVNNYIYRATEIEGFNSESQSQKKVEEMNDFIERLLPKHVVKTLGQDSENVGEKH